MKRKKTFAFGKNWQIFLRTLTPDRVRMAENSILEFLDVQDLMGKSFLDIGCGSGLFSLAAFNLKAQRIVSFDNDSFSVECCRHLERKSESTKNWKISRGSILDNGFTSSLGKFDIVYSWGVLHHTGNMWQAIKNAAELVNRRGFFYIAIYNKNTGLLGSDSWLRIKKLYNSLPKYGKKAMEIAYILAMMAKNSMKLRSLLKGIKDDESPRGMNWRTDITDWLGGYPYESATIEEITNFMKKNFPDFRLANIKRTSSAMGNNWFLFQNGEL